MKQLPHQVVVGTLAALLTSGCLLTARTRAQPVDVVYESSAPEVYVTEPMPAPRVEVVTTAPSQDVLWVDGYWQWGGGGYVWSPGRWARPTRPGYVWNAPRYERRQNRHVYVSGQWAPRNAVVHGSVRGRSGHRHDRDDRDDRDDRGPRRAPPPPAYRGRLD